ncbi:(E)-4-hydroxy-3-methylbut-2-enyl-diphosphate synthase [Mucilaginibacter polytrichastri]|uniref:4-hydroxy-3-methylbut-2-en-1-yl diphosphate synthase (flavodoxin) n=1 Tax=Mucilaginibacter polytrichastri TaxID=1302689 RepID=A0A1Q6A1K7_9SPHI|nr:(E)-4-hydroxy-3-methylbut-2-enyl-diphosphate synthase [Mucilaginibacter polytrichastri]OKS87852.1 4-hydroxy-3-methylbut-2-en-1-yl diphosphate synthase [Mucilaginibacter polytrichastri]SFT26071.1 4-hydroxy-3-methylbut-2-en-1-yl diphosphate synthase [Mucilaginibacter polytrichastri]
MDAEALKLLPGRYCNSLTDYSRFITREVTIGDVPMGGNNPIRIQSMTTTDTMDTMGTVAQSIRMIEAGCEYIRITAPSIKEAQNLANIKKELRQRGYTAPLVADIHFTPNAAEVAARIVEKVRVNPGNYADKKKFDILEYTDAEYQGELERINSKFTPLVNICKEYGTAMRIGTNHGSLSDRIMSRYGDTPQGMVESAMEFIRMCEAMNYYNLCISMKSSNPQVMVQAYRLLVQTMVAENMNYPLHLGVTEAGDGEDGRIKSAVGIGTLLEDGLGDTVRVSLTEEPEAEAPVAIALVERYSARSKAAQENQTSRINNQNSEVLSPGEDLGEAFTTTHSPYEYKKRETYEANAFIGGHMVPRVVVDLSKENLKDPAVLNAAGYLYSAMLDKYNMADQSVDFAYMGDQLPSFNFPGNLKQLYNYNTWKTLASKTNCHPLFTLQEYINADDRTSTLNLVRITNADLETDLFGQIQLDKSLIFVLETTKPHGMADQRAFFFKMEEFGLDVPVIVKRTYDFVGNQDSEALSPGEGLGEAEQTTFLQLYAATDLGALLVDGFGDGIWIDAPQLSTNVITSTAFGILQATRSRISKTEYISCPSCGRTLFDLQETTQMIRTRTSHLKGLKIAIMGCIVNGPGEMADADYGYVGAGPGKITLYRGKEVVKKNVNTVIAVDELISIIQGDGNWVEPAI